MADDNIRHINYASDFRVVFAFPDNKLPDYPWHIELKTPNTPAYNTYVASFDGSVYTRCVPLVDNSILVLVDHHHLAPGILCYQMKRDVPDSLFPDGEMNITTPGCTSIELWDGPSEELSIEQIHTIIATLKGDPGDAGQIESVTASVDGATGIPSVKVDLGGDPREADHCARILGPQRRDPEDHGRRGRKYLLRRRIGNGCCSEGCPQSRHLRQECCRTVLSCQGSGGPSSEDRGCGGPQILGFLGRGVQGLRDL